MTRTIALVLLVALLGGGAGFLLGGMAPARHMPVSLGDRTVLGKGDAYQDVVLPDIAGRQRRLSEWDGKARLLNFWATWCGPCVEEMPLLDAVNREHAGKLQVIGIALDDPQAVAQFVHELGVDYPVLLDRPGPEDSSALYGDVRGVLPYSVLIDAEGRIHATKAGSFQAQQLRDWIEPVL